MNKIYILIIFLLNLKFIILIVNGKDSEYINSMVKGKPELRFQSCGGYMLDNIYGITSGHCCKDDGFQIIEWGSNDITKFKEIRNIIYYNISNKYKDNILYDFCIFVINKPLPIIKTVSIQLEPLEIYTKVNYFGWGRNGKNTRPKILQTATTVIWPQDHCAIFTNESIHPFLDESIFCVNTEPNSWCPGDSGGPVLLDDGTLVGIIQGKEEYLDYCSFGSHSFPAFAINMSHIYEDINIMLLTSNLFINEK